MSTNYKHKDTEELKFNISSVASGKDILALTKVVGDMIDTQETDIKEKTNKDSTSISEVQKNYGSRNPENKTNNKDNTNDSRKNNSHKNNTSKNNSVDDFRELFRYRKPILLEELEKAHRSISEEAKLSKEDNKIEVNCKEDSYIENSYIENSYVEDNLIEESYVVDNRYQETKSEIQEDNVTTNSEIINTTDTKSIALKKPIINGNFETDSSSFEKIDTEVILNDIEDFKITIDLNSNNKNINKVEELLATKKDFVREINLNILNNKENNIEFDTDEIEVSKTVVEFDSNQIDLENNEIRLDYSHKKLEINDTLIINDIELKDINLNNEVEAPKDKISEVETIEVDCVENEREEIGLESDTETNYPSTQATLARQRISELIEQRENSKLYINNQIPIESTINKKAGVKSIAYTLPQWNLLNEPPSNNYSQDTEDALHNALLLEETLANFGVKAQVTNFSEGPTITRFEIQPAPGVKVSRIVNLADDIALCLAAGNVRIEAPIPGKSAVGIEVPNNRNQAVYLKEIIADGSFVHGSSKIMVALGKDIAGKPTVADLSRMPHLLIAGSTGSGKSVCMNSIITSILFRANPDEVKFLMIDPKMVELSVYNGIPHLISPVITDPKKATAALKWVVNEMENRYNLFASNGVRNIDSYNKSLQCQDEKPLPLVVVLIDELADLMMVASRDVEESICRLAQKARAAGIHLVIATQRPSVDVITGIIKANIPSRIAFAVSSQIDSRTILDLAGAEKLLGRGDMLFSPIGTPKPVRVQGVYVSDDEVEEVVAYWKKQGKPEYEAGVLQEVETSNNGTSNNEEDDELLPDAIKMILQSGQASVSLLQRRFRIGYTRAARLIDLMEERGIIGGYEGSKPRSVLMSLEDWMIENGESEG